MVSHSAGPFSGQADSFQNGTHDVSYDDNGCTIWLLIRQRGADTDQVCLILYRITSSPHELDLAVTCLNTDLGSFRVLQSYTLV